VNLAILKTDQVNAVAAHLAAAEAIIQTQLLAEATPEAGRYQLRIAGKLKQVISRRAGD
jgi:hypothetical protein